MWESVGQNIKALDNLANLLNPKTKSTSNAKDKEVNVLAFARKDMEVTAVE